MKKVIVLNSGGLDSTTCVSIAVNKYGSENVSTVSIYYGQRLEKEIECSKKVAEHYGLKRYEIDLSTIFEHSDCTLLKASGKLPEEGSYLEQLEKGKLTSNVPFRNGVFIAAICSLAMSIYPNDEVVIYIGTHSDDFGYPDCSEEFIEAISTACKIGSYGLVTVEAPIQKNTKADTVKLGMKLNTPFEITWSCYKGEEKPCGICASCIDRTNAFKTNHLEDPILRGE